MFLFATPPTARPAAPASPVVDSIRQGAERSGTGFDYLLATARRESALDPTAKAATSSATGLFQFIEQTWLGIVKREGDRVGLGPEASAITARPDGGFAVSDPAARQAILKLREDPEVASVMAGALTQQNRASLAAATGREPSAGELYMAHVLGARGAADLIAAAGSSPNGVAANDFPEAARANRGIFYERGGRPRSSAEVYAVLAGAQAAAPPSARPREAPDVAPTAPVAPGLQGMFQTGSRSGPISDAVAKIWRVNNDGARTRSAALSFFPRTKPLEAATETAPIAATPEVAPISAESKRPDLDTPLPPPRPPAFGTQVRGGPLDLTVFMRRAKS